MEYNKAFPTTPGLAKLNRYISQANKQIAGRHENITPSKVVAELTLGFWVLLLPYSLVFVKRESCRTSLWRACMLFSFGRVFYNNYLLEQMVYEKDFSLSLVLPVSFCLQKSGGR
ncbi:MAG: hypothetical protein K2G02_06035 [Phocaeicola sp.]|uniref:hypothetical protein n=1 Tax=Phocaeicola sp. TaxID=2773926 RepID=UPI0023D3A7FF|nr:hypothetical protein [Phocaeicola sp.]MDE5678063.1 hypothetical protein [Phocaeicola sp.]MDE6180667.1 hypothetical protein [Phocaeicola sp.]